SHLSSRSHTRPRPPPRPTLFPYTTLFRSSAEPSRPSYTSNCQASSNHWRTIVCAKSPLGCSASVRFAKSGASRRNANTSSSRPRSEEHTSELQSRSDLVCRLLLEKKKKDA